MKAKDMDQLQIIGHIIRAFDEATPEEMTLGLQWYQKAHEEAWTLALAAGISLAKAVGIIAVLSPNMKWAENIKDAYALVGLDEERTIRAYGRNIAKAEAIYHNVDESVGGVLTATYKWHDKKLGKRRDYVALSGPKVVSFFWNMLDPSGMDEVTVDRHAARVAAGDSSLSEREFSAYIGTKPKMAIVKGAFFKAARILSARDGVLYLPHQIQAVTWMVIIGQRPDRWQK